MTQRKRSRGRETENQENRREKQLYRRRSKEDVKERQTDN